MFLAAALGTIIIGLIVHFRGTALGPDVRNVVGDALWAAMMAWFAGALAPRARLGIRAAMTFVVCATVEASQLIHAPALDAARSTRIGHLVLGSDFDPRDLLAYGLGVGAASLLEIAFVARSRGPRSNAEVTS